MEFRRYVVVGAALALVTGCRRGEHQGPGEITRSRVPEKVVAARAAKGSAAGRALAGSPKNPALFSSVGGGGTEVGLPREAHSAHKTVFSREPAEDGVPPRRVSALSPQLVGARRNQPPLWQRLQFPLHDWTNRQR